MHLKKGVELEEGRRNEPSDHFLEDCFASNTKIAVSSVPPPGILFGPQSEWSARDKRKWPAALPANKFPESPWKRRRVGRPGKMTVE